MPKPKVQPLAPSLIDTASIVSAVVDQLADRLGNGGTKLDSRLTEIAKCQQDMREDSIRVSGKLDEVSRQVSEIKPTLSAMTSRMQEVEKSIGKPCPFHEMTVKQTEGIADLQRAHAVTEARLTELSNKQSSLSEMQTAIAARMGADVNSIQTSTGALRVEVGQLSSKVDSLKESGGDTKEWVKYLIIALISIVFSVITAKVIGWTSNGPRSSDKAVAVSLLK